VCVLSLTVSHSYCLFVSLCACCLFVVRLLFVVVVCGLLYSLYSLCSLYSITHCPTVPTVRTVLHVLHVLNVLTALHCTRCAHCIHVLNVLTVLTAFTALVLAILCTHRTQNCLFVVCRLSSLFTRCTHSSGDETGNSGD
jgi:hypothetical protein